MRRDAKRCRPPADASFARSVPLEYPRAQCLREVVITGIGPVTPLGTSFAEVAASLIAGRSAVTAMPTGPRPGHALPVVRVADDLESGVPTSLLKTCDRTTLMALKASDRALADAGLSPGDFEAARFGTFLGCAAGATESHRAGNESFFLRDSMSAMTLLRVLPNAPASFVSMRHGLRGECSTNVSGAAASTQAIGSALRAIRRGELDLALAGGIEAPLAATSLRMFETFGLLAPLDAEAPARSYRTFARGRSGMVLGEGGALFVLESLEHALARRATIHARLSGYATGNDASDIAEPCAATQAHCMHAALADARLDASEIQYVRGMGCGTPSGDAIETQALKLAFGDRAHAVPVSSTKPMHGHLLGASGAMELISALVPLRYDILPPTLNVDDADPACDLDYVPEVARQVAVRHVLANTFSMGGQNASLVLRRWDAASAPRADRASRP
jgi:3-oxoacyl-[acyl-carrier-protein] synthase II